MLPVLGMVLMFTSSIFFPLNAVPEKFRQLMFLNPLTYVVETTRGAMFHHNSPEFYGFALYFIAAISIFVFGSYIFNKLKRGFADVM